MKRILKNTNCESFSDGAGGLYPYILIDTSNSKKQTVSFLDESFEVKLGPVGFFWGEDVLIGYITEGYLEEVQR